MFYTGRIQPLAFGSSLYGPGQTAFSVTSLKEISCRYIAKRTHLVCVS